MGEEPLLACAVRKVLEGRVEEALKLLSHYYGVDCPSIRVGLPKRHLKAYGCYDPRRKLICVRSSEEFRNPFIIMHEFYHHLRYFGGVHRGTERRADKYALGAIEAYLRYVKVARDPCIDYLNP